MTKNAGTYPPSWARVNAPAHPTPMPGQVWLDQDLKNAKIDPVAKTALRRTVRIIRVDDTNGRVLVRHTVTGRRSWVRRAAFDPPRSPDYGYVLIEPAMQRETIDSAVARA